MSFNVYDSSIMEMDVECSNFEWSKGESIRSELIKFEGLDITWRVMFYPSNSIESGINHSSPSKTKYTQIKIVVEDRTAQKLQYKFRFSCEGGITIDWSSEFSNSGQEVMYDRSMSKATRYIEKLYTIPRANDFNEIYDFFEMKADLNVKPLPHMSHDDSSSIELCLSEASDDSDQFDTSSVFELVTAPIVTSVRSLEFLACISQIIADTKVEDENVLDLNTLATQLADSAKKFNLPDLGKISAVFLEFQISDDNFADVLEMAVGQKSAALLNSATKYITENQKELRATDQWEKMKACPILMFSVMEKLFIKKN